MTWTGAGHTIIFTSASGEPPPPTSGPPQDILGDVPNPDYQIITCSK